MPTGVILQGTSGNQADVDANNQLKVNLTRTQSLTGLAGAASRTDPGLATGSTLIREIDSTPQNRLRVGVDSILFQEYFAGTSQNSSVWGAPIAGSCALAQTGGFITLNSGSDTTSTDGCILRSNMTIPIFGTYAIYNEMLARIPNTSFNNSLIEWGLGMIGVSPGTACQDGAYFRYNSTGLYCVQTVNGTDVTATLIGAAALSNAGITLTNTNHWIVALDDDQVIFWCNNVLLLRIARAATGTQTTMSQQMCIFARQYNSSTNTLSALQLAIAMITVSAADGKMDLPFSHRMTSSGNALFQTYTPLAPVKTAVFQDATHEPTNQITTPSVTALGSAGYAGLGGRQRLGNGAGTIALSADSAYIIYSYQVPDLVITAPITPAKTMMVTGIKISGSNKGAVGPAGILTAIWTLYVGCRNANPATPEAIGTPVKLARTIELGQTSLVTTAPIGAMFLPDIALNFDSPIPYYPGEYFQLAFTPLVAYTIASNQEFLFTAAVYGYWR